MSKNYLFEYNAKEKAVDRLKSERNEDRARFIFDVFVKYFGEGIQQNPRAFHGRFRKMSESAFNFYRGSALLFYQDLKVDKDKWISTNPSAGQIFIHGDLHAENFGTYLNSQNEFVFDVNDFDEGYVAPFTWDLKRLLASINLIGYSKCFSDSEIEQLLRACIDSYVRQVYEFCRQKNDKFQLTLSNTSGPIKKLLDKARLKSHVKLLDSKTRIENNQRKFIRSETVQDVNPQTRSQITHAFQNYLKTIPDYKKENDQLNNYEIHDVVAQSSPGVGSAGKISYSILLGGSFETLEDDVILYMKPAQKSALSYVIHNPELDRYFQHDGLRTVLCTYAMQASTPKWLGYTSLGAVPCVVDQVSAFSEDLSWKDVQDLNDIIQIVQYLGKATAKIHCVADSDCVNLPKNVSALPFSIIPKNTEMIIHGAIGGNENQFIDEMVNFGMVYGSLVRRDHRIFCELFRNKHFPGLDK